MCGLLFLSARRPPEEGHCVRLGKRGQELDQAESVCVSVSLRVSVYTSIVERRCRKGAQAASSPHGDRRFFSGFDHHSFDNFGLVFEREKKST